MLVQTDLRLEAALEGSVLGSTDRKDANIPSHPFPSSLGPLPFSLANYNRYNKYASVCARATRQALKEEERVKADRRGEMALRYQQGKDGKAGDQVGF